MGQMGAPDARGLPPPPEEEARGRFKSSPPWCGALTVLRTRSNKTAVAPAWRRSRAPCDRHRHPWYALANHRTPAPPCPRVLCQQSDPNPCGTRISPQCLCTVLSTVQLSARGAHPTPCTIRGRAGLSRRGAPLGQAGERATTTIGQCGARDGRGVPLQLRDRLLPLLLLLLLLLLRLRLMLRLLLLLRLRCCC